MGQRADEGNVVRDQNDGAAPRAMLPDLRHDPIDVSPILADERLVEEEQLRPAPKGGQQGQPPLLAEAEREGGTPPSPSSLPSASQRSNSPGRCCPPSIASSPDTVRSKI